MTENTIENYRNQIAISRTEIKNLRSQLTALKYDHWKEIKSIESVLSNLKCTTCNESASHYVISNATDTPSTSNIKSQDNVINYHPIGHIKSSFQNKRGVPRQPCVVAQSQGTVVLNRVAFNNPEHALIGLEEFSHMWIIFHFHNLESNSTPAKVSPPRLEGDRRGVFSTRSPHRPCAIGLSLVSIQSIEGTNINFFGVDMINGTPVLDIKPFIPQYDYPLLNTQNVSTDRPRTEGVSDVVQNMTNLQIAQGFDLRSLSPRLGNSITDTTPQSPYEDEIPPPLYDDIPPPQLDVTPDTPEECKSWGYERGAPDGQERFTPLNAPILNNGIRIASWITNPPSQTYRVTFTEDVTNRLQELIGERSESFKVNIKSLLSEDPRSNYVKNKYPEHEYCCVLEDLSISCVFDNRAATCTIIAVRNAQEMQDS